MTDAPTAPAEKTFMGHPTKLFILFSTEMWERFGYYGMRAVLLLYLTKHFLFEQKQGVAIYTAYVSLVYLTPLIGGLVADKILGSRNAVKLGAVFMSVGYFMLSFGGPPAKDFIQYGGVTYPVVAGAAHTDDANSQYLQTPSGAKLKVGPGADGGIALQGAEAAGLPSVLPKGQYEKKVERNSFSVYLAMLSLSLVIIGNGFFKPNISTMVGDLYSRQDKRRDAAFTIFYMGINLGAFLGQVLLPNLRVTFGFSVPFLAAAVGMFLALVISFASDKALAKYGAPPSPDSLRKPVVGIPMGWLVVILSLVAVLPAWFLINNDPATASAVLSVTPDVIKPYIENSPLVGWLLMGGGTLIYIGLIAFSLASLPRVERERMVVALVLCIFSILFWALFEQAGTSLTLFADQNTDRHIFGWNMPPEQTQFFNAIFIVVLAPIFSWIWTVLAKRKLEPPTPYKFAIGIMLAGVGFLALAAAGNTANGAALVGIQWLALTYLIHTVGELFLSPVGLSMITRLSVPRLVGLMMGAWYLSSSMAQYVGGIIAGLMATETIGGQVLDPHASLKSSIDVFWQIGFLGLGVGVALLLVSPILKAWMHEGKTTTGEPEVPGAVSATTAP